MLRFVTTADTEILATAAAVERLPGGFPEVRCANPGGHPDPAALIAEVLDGARVVLCRILGGRRGWPEGLDLLVEGCRAQGAVLLALGGEAEPDAEMTALSTAPAGAVAQAGEYLRHGDVDNVEQLLRFLADTFLLDGHGFEPPREVADLGVYADPPARRRLDRRGARAARPGPAYGRHLLLPLAPPDGEHGLRRRAGPRDRGRRGQRARRVELHAAPRRRRTRAGAGPPRRARRRPDHDDARDGRQRRRRRLRRGGRRGRRDVAGLGRDGARRARRPGDPGRLLHLVARDLA